jgi:hypothetical protein
MSVSLPPPPTTGDVPTVNNWLTQLVKKLGNLVNISSSGGIVITNPTSSSTVLTVSMGRTFTMMGG